LRELPKHRLLKATALNAFELRCTIKNQNARFGLFDGRFDLEVTLQREAKYHHDQIARELFALVLESRTTAHKTYVTNLWKYLTMAVLVLMVTAGAFFAERFQTPPKLSPFTQVDVEGDKI